MLHGYVVVVKRTGVDGSKFPVTERTIKIGVSAGCHILINTPYVADEHCALTVKDNGQVFVKNLTKNYTTALNETNIDSEALLNHGDILEIGGRLVRWQYLPDSKFYCGAKATNAAKSPSSKSSRTPKNKIAVVRSPKTPSSALKVNTPKKHLVGLKINTPKSAMKTPIGKKILTSTKKSSGTPKSRSPKSLKKSSPKVQKTPSIKTPKSTKVQTNSPRSIKKDSPNVQKSPLTKTPKSTKVEKKSPRSIVKSSPKVQKTPPIKTPKSTKAGTNSPRSIKKASPKAQKTPSTKTPKSTESAKSQSNKKASPKVQITLTPKSIQGASNSSSSFKKSSPKSLKTPTIKINLKTPQTKSLLKSRGKTPIKAKTPKAIRKSLFTSPKDSPKGKLGSRTPRKTNSPGIADKASEKKTPMTPIAVKGNSNVATKLSGRKSLQATKRLFSAADHVRRKSEAICKLNDEELLELASLNYRKKLSEEKSNSIKRQGTPLKRLTNTEKRASRHRSSMKILPMSTILEPTSATKIGSLKSNNLLNSSSPSSSKDVRSKPLTTLVNKRNSELPLILFSPLQKSPAKRLTIEPNTPTKISAKDLIDLMNLSNKTPPEVVTPERSPIKNRRSANQSPLTPLYRVMTIGVVEETPPEVVTPRSSMSSSSSVTRLRNSLPNSPLATQSPLKSTRKSTSPIKSILLSPTSPRKSALKPSNSPKSSPRGNKENLNNSTISPKVSFKLLESPKDKKVSSNTSFISPGRSSGRILSETSKKEQSPLSRKSSPLKISAVASTRGTPGKNTINDGSPLPISVSAINETRHQSPSKRSSLRNSSPANLSFKSAESSLVTPKASPVAKMTEARSKKKVKLNSQPDKTKKKALLILGKASRKKTEILVKQKILKRAIKLTNRQPSKKITGRKEGTPKIVITSPSTTNNSPGKGKITPEKLTSPKKIAIESRPSGSSSFGSVLKELAYPNLTSPNYRRRSSKRLSAMHEVERPDFTELSPSALGLTPRFVQPILTPKEKKRRSTSLTTPRATRSPSTIKAVSASMKSSKTKENDSTNSSFNFQTPDISQEMFVSPLNTPGVKSKNTPVPLRKRVSRGALFNSSDDLINFFTPEKAATILPTVKRNRMSSLVEETHLTFLKKNQTGPDALSEKKVSRKSKTIKSPKNDLTQVAGIKRIFSKSPRNDLRRVGGIKRLLKTPQQKKTVVKRPLAKREIKSPKNDLSDPMGISKLFATRKVQNDLSNVAGVRTLFKPQKSPKNRLSDLRGVKKLLGSPKVQKQPANSYLDIEGVRQLFASPKTKRSPVNDLRTVVGVKELFEVESPKPVQRKVRGAATPIARPTRSKALVEEKIIGNNEEFDALPTKARTRQKRLSSPKSDSPLKVAVPKSDPSKTPIRRGRPKRTATAALENDNVIPPKSRRGATSQVRDSLSTEPVVKPQTAKQPSSPKLSPVRKTRGRGKTQPDPVSSPNTVKKVGTKANQRSKPQAKTQSVESPAKKVSPKALRSRTQTTDPVSSPITKAVRTRGKAQPSPASSPKGKTKAAKTIEATTRSTRAQSANPAKKTATSIKTVSSKRGRRI